MLLTTVNNQKAGFYNELEKFAARTKNREFIRIIGIITDNSQKGIKLIEKLKRENNLLWAERKRKVERNGAIMETKSIVPMSLMLGVLVIITVSPALLTM